MRSKILGTLEKEDSSFRTIVNSQLYFQMSPAIVYVAIFLITVLARYIFQLLCIVSKKLYNEIEAFKTLAGKNTLCFIENITYYFQQMT